MIEQRADTMRMLISFAALFLSVILLQLSSGGLRTTGRAIWIGS